MLNIQSVLLIVIYVKNQSSSRGAKQAAHTPPRCLRVLLRLPPLFGVIGGDNLWVELLKESARPLRGVGFALRGVFAAVAHMAFVLAVDPGVSNLGSNTFFGVLKASSCFNRIISFFSSEQS